MNKITFMALLFATILLFSCKSEISGGNSKQSAENTIESESEQSFKIAFGSCGEQEQEIPVFNEIVRHKPDLFVFLGDNIYGDSKNPEVLREKYRRLGNIKSFQNLKQNIPIIATWDDHDFGWDDSGRHYPLKKESKEIFMDFFEEPEDSERRTHEGIYISYDYKIADKTVQIILLDERTFRDDLPDYKDEVEGDYRYFYDLDHGINKSKDSTMLGEEQWNWLKTQFQKPADLRIIGSGTQFGIEFNSYEAWANFPHEQQKMLSLINETKANSVIFISGDVHYAEISKLVNNTTYPIYDITASGLTETWLFPTPNKNRIEGPVMDNHFGLLTYYPDKETVKAEIYDVTGNQRIEYDIHLNQLLTK